MPAGLTNLRFHIAEQQNGEPSLELTGRSPSIRGVGRAAADTTDTAFRSDEAAARYYLSNLFNQDNRPGIRGLSAPEQPSVVPDLQMLSSQEVQQTNTRVVRFQQTKARIPIFGSLALVELDQNRELVSINAEVADVRGISAVAELSPAKAVDTLAAYLKVKADSLEYFGAPELCFFHDDTTNEWHLAYYIRKVNVAPPAFLNQSPPQHGSAGHGLGRSPRTDRPQFDYLLDAHSGGIVFFFASNPMMAVPVPSKLRGSDEDGTSQTFWGNMNNASFEMFDPIRRIKTFDFNFRDIAVDPFPTAVITSSQALLQSKAAVSAHVNATRVFDFYKSILLRDGIDDKGMDLISAINCTYPRDEPPPDWHNAVWYNDRMWYGQLTLVGGTSQSFSRYLDVIAHELTHGITEYTCNLIYRNQSGALNESFSDIFAIIIKNWYLGDPNSVTYWNWELGSGLGQSGLPLRDMSNPSRTGDPAHMNQYLKTSADNGGVHTNSNIHNKACYNLMTAKDSNGNYVVTPREVATLYYLALTRLSRTADFSATRQALNDVAKTYYAGDRNELAAKTAAIDSAYARAGIF